MKACPNCGFQRDPINTECPKCGIIFKKWGAIQAREQGTEKTGNKKIELDKEEAGNNVNLSNILDIWLLRKDLQDLKYNYQSIVKNRLLSIYVKRFVVIIILIGFVLSCSVISSSITEDPKFILLSFFISGVIAIIFFFIFLTRTRKEIGKNKVTQEVNHEKRKVDMLSKKIAEWGYEIDSEEHKTLGHFFYSLFYLVGNINFRFISIHDMGHRRAFELRSGDSEAGAIEYEKFSSNVTSDIKKIAEEFYYSDDTGKLKFTGKNPFPSLFLFTHECKFLTIYGEEVTGVDAMASILFEEIVKIKPAFNVDLLHHVARIEISQSGVDMENLDYETLAQPGIVKGQNRRRENIPLELRDILLREANYACVECGASAADGATLEVDHIVPFSKGGTDEYENLQILCATCNRKKGSSL